MLMIRLRRMGGRSKPFYRVVVSDSRRTPTSAAVEELGTYEPKTDPPALKVNRERLDHWLGQGAHLSPTLRKLVAPRAS